MEEIKRVCPLGQDDNYREQIKYRIARFEDLIEICSLVQNAICTMIGQNILQWDEIYPNEEVLREDIRKKQLYVGIVDKQIAVIYVLNQEFEDEYKNGKWKYEDKSSCVVHRLCVNSVFQNKGVGKTTMQHIEKEVLSMGIQAIRLDAFTENPFALKLYDSLGYSIVGHANWRKGKFYLMEKYL